MRTLVDLSDLHFGRVDCRRHVHRQHADRIGQGLEIGGHFGPGSWGQEVGAALARAGAVVKKRPGASAPLEEPAPRL